LRRSRRVRMELANTKPGLAPFGARPRP
jgi:hypothetical protein